MGNLTPPPLQMLRYKYMHKGNGLRGRGEYLGTVAETGNSGETAEGKVILYFGGGNRAAATGIRQVWLG